MEAPQKISLEFWLNNATIDMNSLIEASTPPTILLCKKKYCYWCEWINWQLFLTEHNELANRRVIKSFHIFSLLKNIFSRNNSVLCWLFAFCFVCQNCLNNFSALNSIWDFKSMRDSEMNFWIMMMS